MRLLSIQKQGVIYMIGILSVFMTFGCTQTRETPNLVGQDMRLTLLHTSDIHSRILPYTVTPNRFERQDGLVIENKPFGGIARMATVVEDERRRATRSLWLDSGDIFQGAPIFNLFHGEAEVRALSRAGLDVSVLGNHEFDAGSRNLFNQLDNWSSYMPIAANYLFDKPRNPDERSLNDIVEPFVVYDLDGVSVGVIGMGNYSSMTGIFEGGNSLGIRPINSTDVIRRYVGLLRPVVDVVVVVSHLGLDEDEGLSSDELETDILNPFPLQGVDLILGGHLHVVLDPPKVIPNDDQGHQTIVVHSGAFAKYVGRLDIVVRMGEDNNDPKKRSRITAFTYENLPIDSRIPEHPDLVELLRPYTLRLNDTINLDGVFAYINAEDGIDRSHDSGGDSQLGNLVARTMQTRAGVEAEFALTNSLGIRTDFDPGILTREQMFNVFPFENDIVIMYLSGTEVQAMLDFVSQRSSGRGCRTQAQVSGIWFDMVCDSEACPKVCDSENRCEAPRACAKNIALGENCRNGNPNGSIDFATCNALEHNSVYRVAVNDYIAQGGSGFDVLERNTFKQYTNITIRDAFVQFLRTQKTCPESICVNMDSTGEASDTEDGGNTCVSVQSLYGTIACIDNTLEPHDGRIRAIFE